MQPHEIKQQVESIFEQFGLSDEVHGDLIVTTPLTGEQIGAVKTTSVAEIEAMVEKSVKAQAPMED